MLADSYTRGQHMSSAKNSHLTTTRTRVKLLDVTMILLSKIRLEEQTDRGEILHH